MDRMQGTEFGTYKEKAPQYQGTTTQSIYIPMRDGVQLAMEVILPADLGPGAKIPTLLMQNRYWRAMEMRVPWKWVLKPSILNPHFRDFFPFFASQGYAHVAVDVRGTGASFGTWPHPWHIDTIEDAREIVDWIVAQPWSNGRVGAHGISYLGTTAELLTVLDHPAVRAVIPMFNHPDAFTDIAFPGGIFDRRFINAWGHFDMTLDHNILPDEFGLLGKLLFKGVKPVDADGNRQMLAAALREHAENGHAYLLAQNITGRDEQHPERGFCVDDMTVHRFTDEVSRSNTITCGWASWMDAGTADAAIRRFLTFDNARQVVIGAWEHGGRFNASPYRSPDAPASPTLPDQWREMLRFFDNYLKESGNGVREERVLFYYTMGEERWKKTPVWPPEGTTSQRWYLAENKTLSLVEPGAESGTDSYTVDFEASTGEYNRWWEMGVLDDQTVIYPDRAEADRRLLTYTSSPLAQDTEITGYPVVTLYTSSTETDGAFYVYLEDLDKDGRVTYVTEGQLRALHRKVSTEPAPYKLQVPHHTFKMADAAPLVPGEIAELAFGLHPTSVLIRKGHRIRIAIAGHDEGTFDRIPAEGTPTITVARNRLHASCIDLPLVQKS